MDEETAAFLTWAEGLSADELAAEIALLEAREAQTLQDLADVTWELEMFRSFSAAPPPPGMD
ncbi:hypothetical protein [Streptantibioticus ferralitis]|uniref:Uncharacterized protein n=1 Tax=Streptantibioticus ferralitis TaxID=236510 RepID=A0ABT5Z772_9ACTN|nr:hypothetical protein [Streptantibioticus ferralitis]MDF2259670.1 hypothetical protein [Streptantibioticus ferralitis]